jgi:hypothetical protein
MSWLDEELKKENKTKGSWLDDELVAPTKSSSWLDTELNTLPKGIEPVKVKPQLHEGEYINKEGLIVPPSPFEMPAEKTPLNQSRYNIVGQNMLPRYKEDAPLAAVGKDVVNYGLGTAGRVVGALGQAGMQLVSNVGNVVQGKQLDFSEKTLKKDILPKQYGQLVDNLAAKGAAGQLASGFIQGAVEGGLDPGTWVGGLGVLDDAARAGLVGKSAKLGTTENVLSLSKNQSKLNIPLSKQSATKGYLNAERNAAKRVNTPDVIYGKETGSPQQLSLPAPAKQNPFTQVKYSTTRIPTPDMKPAIDNPLLDSMRKNLGLGLTPGEISRKTGADAINLMRKTLDLGGTRQVGEGFASSKMFPLAKKPQQTLFSDNMVSHPYIATRNELPKSTLKPAALNSNAINQPVQKAAQNTAIAKVEVKSSAPVKADIQDLVRNSDSWKDKGGVLGPLKLQRETWDRNIIDIAGKEDGEKIRKALFEPVHDNEAVRIRWMNEERDKIRKLNLNSEESALVQRYGEGKLLDEELQTLTKNPERIKSAVKVFGEFYNKVLPMANEALIRNGYKSVGKLGNYFPHFDGSDPLLKALGIKLDVTDLPTDINGLTHQFKPGKNWFGNFLKREGDQTTFDAVQGADRYIEGISKVIYHTDDIKNLRDFTRALRMKSLPEGIQERVHQILNDTTLSMNEREALANEIISEGRTHLSNAVADLDEYTNVLAGKKDLADRSAERSMGRQMYNITNAVMNNVGKNLVAINPASWLTNFIPLTQALATTNKKAVLRSLNETMRNIVKNDEFINKSTFLTNRIGSNILDKGVSEKASDVLAAPFKWIDNFTSQVVTRSKYLENVEKGMKPNDAMKHADRWASNIMGDRSLGAQPTLFNQRNPIKRAFTQFQLEVNNQLSFLFKDMPREYAGNKKMLGSAIGQLMIYGWLYNNLYEKTIGRRPALDPIGIAFDFGKDLVNPNLKKGQALTNLGENALNSLPFTGTAFGGRIPVGSAFENIGKGLKGVYDVATGNKDLKTGLPQAGYDVAKGASHIVLPFGAGQIFKTAEGISAVNSGGKYSTNAQGEKSLQYPIAKSLGNYVKGGLFGKSALPETQEYYNNNRRALSPSQTQAYETSGDPETYKALMRKREIDSLKEQITKVMKDKDMDPEKKQKKVEELYGKLMMLNQ